MKQKLDRTLGMYSALMISIGTMIGSAIFVLAGTSYATAGPGASLAIFLAGIAAVFTGLSFAENILLMAVAYMLAGVIPAPSGIGALEFVFLLFFTGFVEAGAALPAILLFRFVTWILPFGVGGGVLIWMRTRGY